MIPQKFKARAIFCPCLQSVEKGTFSTDVFADGAGALPPSPAGLCPAPAGALPPSPLLFNVKSSKSKSRSAELEKSLHSLCRYFLHIVRTIPYVLYAVLP